ncbi:hypothetical protein X994_850 [Burkholderia pseudomallei]|uniref:hypothetical protein n=1 Tax=Burkholderia pseudomallei TaxID=28450 RepID=UPI00052A345B|nr:hypothetical protein [Burkholderia pseudomallei]AIV50159.1 hypothetical protein Y603_1011 [Burkholderia pseudomallei MSHR1153]AIV79015.1 hypothetical protein X994_850 [Burkholderia pseudomallei]
MLIAKPTFEELGALLRIAGSLMEDTGLMPAVILGQDRDHGSDALMLGALRDEGICASRAIELIGLSLEEIAQIEP